MIYFMSDVNIATCIPRKDEVARFELLRIAYNITSWTRRPRDHDCRVSAVFKTKA